jgi:hypothetical protein
VKSPSTNFLPFGNSQFDPFKWGGNERRIKRQRTFMDDLFGQEFIANALNRCELFCASDRQWLREEVAHFHQFSRMIDAIYFTI